MSFSVRITAQVEADPDEAFARLEDLSAYPGLTPTVHEVLVTREGGEQRSAWRVAFRGGILCWTERDIVDAAGRRIVFEQIDGDVDRFDGSWAVVAEPGTTTVVFEADLDLGIASLAPIVDPVARTTLVEVIGDILVGLFGPVAVVTADEASLAP